MMVIENTSDGHQTAGRTGHTAQVMVSYRSRGERQENRSGLKVRCQRSGDKKKGQIDKSQLKFPHWAGVEGNFTLN